MFEAVPAKLGKHRPDAARQRELWARIAKAYEDGGADGVSEEIEKMWAQKAAPLGEAMSEVRDLL